ncbi:MAG: hypothetical protein WC343_02965 [Bacilli bacterium]|jgi:uncharacterized protein YbaR (Trm112 family)
MIITLHHIPSACPSCKERLKGLTDDDGWVLSDPKYSSSQVLHILHCPHCNAEIEYIRSKTCPISWQPCLRDECMGWQRPVGHSRSDDGKCGILPTHGGV